MRSSECYPSGHLQNYKESIEYNEEIVEGFTSKWHPRVFITVGSGCGGSIWVQKTLREMLKNVFKDDYGYKTVILIPDQQMGNEFEWLKGTEDKNNWCTADPPCAREVLKNKKGSAFATQLRRGLYHRKILEWNCPEKPAVSIFVTKLPAMELDNLVIIDELKKEGARFIGTWRDNVIDKHCCMIKDCMGDQNWGYPVDEKGNKSTMCFDRRKSDVKIKAHVNPYTLVEELHNKMNEPEILREKMRIGGVKNMKVLPLSSLSACMYSTDEKSFDTSVSAWSDLLHRLGLKASQKTIRNVLSKNRGTKKLEPHSQSIYNYSEVSDIIAREPEFATILR